LILIVQADIAAARATISAEKASTLNFLQNVKMATAFSMERSVDNHHELYYQAIASTGLHVGGYSSNGCGRFRIILLQ